MLVVLLAFTAYQLYANLPADPPLGPAAAAEVGGELGNLCTRFEECAVNAPRRPMQPNP